MSMKVLTVLQFISIFTIYTGLFIAVPALLLHRRLKDEIFSVRFFFYIVLGHFYLINLVLFLQLLHISGRFWAVHFQLLYPWYIRKEFHLKKSDIS